MGFKNLFLEMDTHLSEHEWLSGDNISLADVSLVVYLTRLTSFQMSPLWKDKPFLTEWFERIKDRKSYKLAIDDWGDKTADRRKKEGEQAFEKIKKLWNEEN